MYLELFIHFLLYGCFCMCQFLRIIYFLLVSIGNFNHTNLNQAEYYHLKFVWSSYMLCCSGWGCGFNPSLLDEFYLPIYIHAYIRTYRHTWNNSSEQFYANGLSNFTTTCRFLRIFILQIWTLEMKTLLLCSSSLMSAFRKWMVLYISDFL